MRPPAPSLRAATLLASAAIAVAGCSSGEAGGAGEAAPSKQDVRAALEGSPPALAALHRQSNQLLGGGPKAFRARLRELRGHPVVVNKWASWCGPCRVEFPAFQGQALERGNRVAFIGVNSNDSAGGARGLLEQFPVSYPSYTDPDQKIAAVFNAAVAFPSTAFYDSKGELAYVRQGPYRDQRDLAADIERYAR
jgi:thiol-disulfide isomerase/thioredoxin